MSLVEGGLAGHGAVHGYLGQLSKFCECLGCSGEQHTHTRPDDGLASALSSSLTSVFDIAGSRESEVPASVVCS